MRLSFNENLKRLIKFCEENNRLPSKNGNVEERRLNGFALRNKSTNPLVNEIINKYKKKKRTFEEGLNELKDYCKKYGRLPKSNGTLDSRINSFISRNRSNKLVIDILNKYKIQYRRTFDENLNDLISYCNETNRLPYPYEGRRESRLSRFVNCHRDNDKIKSVINKYRRTKTFDENLSDLIKYCEKWNKLPNTINGDPSSGRLRSFMRFNSEDPRVIRVVDKYRIYKKRSKNLPPNNPLNY